MIEFSSERVAVPAPVEPAPQDPRPAVATDPVAPLPLGQAIRRAARTTLLQPKLMVGASDDPSEREADAVADRVVRSLRSTDAPSSGRVRRSAPMSGRIGFDAVSDPAVSDDVSAGRRVLARDVPPTIGHVGAGRSSGDIRRDHIDDKDGFVDAITGKGRKVMRSSELKAVLTCLDAVIAQKNPALREGVLVDLVTAIDAWQAKASADSPRRPAMTVLRTQAGEHLAFVRDLEFVSATFGFSRELDDLERAFALYAGIADSGLREHEAYTERFGQIQGDRARAADNRDVARVSDTALEAAVTAARRTLPDEPSADQVFAAYVTHLAGAEIQYDPGAGGTGADVFTGAGSADCSSVAKGLSRFAIKLGIDAKRVDCGSSNFLTAAVPEAGSMPGPGNITDSTRTGAFPGRRFHFKTHYVTEMAGAKYCGVIGAKWTDACVAHGPAGSPNGFVLAAPDSLPAGATLDKVYGDSGFGIAKLDDRPHIVEVRPEE